MLAKRIIPCLDIKDGRTVKGTNFVNLKDAGDPIELAMEYEKSNADELVFLDISATENKSALLVDLVQELAACLSIPFSVGGGIKNIQDAYKILQNGADKIAINSAAVHRPELINELANSFGNQCVIVAVDAKFINDEWIVFTHGGKKITNKRLLDWVRDAEQRGAGEILFTSMDHDGTKNGFAIDALKQVEQQINVPVIASGGAGEINHFAELFQSTNINAALAASIFHYKEVSIPDLKQILFNNKINIRL